MRAFYEAFSIGIAIFACILFLITMGKAVAGDLALWQWIALVLSEITCSLRFASRCMRTHFARINQIGRVLRGVSFTLRRFTHEH